MQLAYSAIIATRDGTSTLHLFAKNDAEAARVASKHGRVILLTLRREVAAEGGR